MVAFKKDQNRFLFGLCSVALYRYDITQTAPASIGVGRFRGEFLQEFNNVENFNFSANAESILADAFGCFTVPPAVESGAISGECSFSATQALAVRTKEVLFNTTFTDTPIVSDTALAITNKVGTTVQNATTGIASVSIIASSTNVKPRIITIRAVSATTVDILADGVIYRTALTVAGSGANTDIAELGLRLVGGSGTINFTTGHQAAVETIPVASSRYYAEVGTDFTGADFFIIAKSQQTQAGLFNTIILPRVKLSGGQFTFESKTFHKTPLTGTVYAVDEVLNGRQVLFAGIDTGV
jgi:hypothetical protein